MPLLRLGRPLMPASAIPGGTRAQRRIAPNGSEIHQGYLLNIESFLRRLANWAIWTAARAPVRAASPPAAPNAPLGPRARSDAQLRCLRACHGRPRPGRPARAALMDVLVIVGGGEPPARIGDRARLVQRLEPSSAALDGLVGALRARIPRGVGV